MLNKSPGAVIGAKLFFSGFSSKPVFFSLISKANAFFKKNYLL